VRRVLGLLFLAPIVLVLGGCPTPVRVGSPSGPADVNVPDIAAAAADLKLTGFIDEAAIKLLSDRERAESRNAQFYALQFGRAGAPRAWAGDRGASGEVVVGPPVIVNSLYCRNFTHRVSVGGQNFITNGTACRDEEGLWSAVTS
jgi:surface antigen